jgi:protein Tex
MVYISMLSINFVKDPHEMVKAGEAVRVKVLEVDLPCKRIARAM